RPRASASTATTTNTAINSTSRRIAPGSWSPVTDTERARGIYPGKPAEGRDVARPDRKAPLVVLGTCLALAWGGCADRHEAVEPAPYDEAYAGGEQTPAPRRGEPPPAGDEPPPPEFAPPVTAPPAEVPEGIPPHPDFPEPLDEPEPTQAELDSTEYVWLPGHWVWNGEAYEWQEGRWIYPLPGYVLVPPRWEWNGEAWVFHHAGWAEVGSDVVVYAPRPVEEGAAAEEAIDVYVEPSTPTYYTWSGAYVAPLVIYPR